MEVLRRCSQWAPHLPLEVSTSAPVAQWISAVVPIVALETVTQWAWSLCYSSWSVVMTVLVATIALIVNTK